MLESGVTPLAHPGGSASYSLPIHSATASPYRVNLKNTDFVDTMSSQVLHDLWFSLKQSPESACHYYIGILLNMIIGEYEFFKLVLVLIFPVTYQMLTQRLSHYLHNIVFKIKYKFYRAYRLDPPTHHLKKIFWVCL
jgi:hypothetical protein